MSEIMGMEEEKSKGGSELHEKPGFHGRERADELIKKINSCDPEIARVDWFEETSGYDGDILGYIYDRINVDRMLDIVTELILIECDRLLKTGQIIN